MTDIDTADLPVRPLSALAGVCGYHEGDDCLRCQETLGRLRKRGWTDAEILADIALYQSDFAAWAKILRIGRAAEGVR